MASCFPLLLKFTVGSCVPEVGLPDGEVIYQAMFKGGTHFSSLNAKINKPFLLRP